MEVTCIQIYMYDTPGTLNCIQIKSLIPSYSYQNYLCVVCYHTTSPDAHLSSAHTSVPWMTCLGCDILACQQMMGSWCYDNKTVTLFIYRNI